MSRVGNSSKHVDCFECSLVRISVGVKRLEVHRGSVRKVEPEINAVLSPNTLWGLRVTGVEAVISEMAE